MKDNTEIWMCYGCCCGVVEKDSRYTPSRQPIDIIRTAIEKKMSIETSPEFKIRKTGCLGPCSSGNMVVVHKKGFDAVVFQGVNSAETGEKVAGYAAEMSKKDIKVEIPDTLKQNSYGTVNADEVPDPPSHEPYADRH